MDELTQTRLIVLLIVLAAAALWAAGVARDRRRNARFAALAQSLGREAIREGEFLSRFAVEIEGRTLDVRYEHRSGGGRGGGTWYVVTAVPLQEVSELHSTDIRPRWRRRGTVETLDDFERHFDVRDAGYPLRDGWLNGRVRKAITHFYALALPLYLLSIEEGCLIHRSPLSLRQIDGVLLRELLARQVAVAAALERAL